MRRIIALMAAVAATLLFAAPAGAATDSYDGGDEDITPTETSRPAGEDIEVGGETEEPGIEVGDETEERPETAGAGQLPATGSDSLPLLQIGVGLMVIGGMVVLATRALRPARVRVDTPER